MTADNASCNWQYGGGMGPPPMEPIQEEDDYLSASCSHATGLTSTTSQQGTPSKRTTAVVTVAADDDATSKTTRAEHSPLGAQMPRDCRITESKQRVREVYTTEEVDTLVSTLPKESVPEEWTQIPSEEVVLDSNMAHTYLTELAGGTPSARSSKYTYTYETHVDEPDADGRYDTTPHGAHYQQKHRYANGAASGQNQHELQIQKQQHLLENGNGYSEQLNEEVVTHFSESETLPLPPLTAANSIASTTAAAAAADAADIERHSKSTQKVTRVTKITTTRSVRQIPVDPDDICFDADGNPILNAFDNASATSPQYDNGGSDGGRGSTSLGIDLSRTFISEHEEYSTPVSNAVDSSTEFPVRQQPPYGMASFESGCDTHSAQQQERQLIGSEALMLPSSSGAPQVTEISASTISLRWRPPQRDGSAGPTLGYRVEFCRAESDDWEPAHDDLLSDSECKITNLEPLNAYYFRVSTANCAGFGPPSASTPPIYINAQGTAHMPENGPPRPSRPIVTDIGNDCATIEWRSAQPPTSYDGAPIVGYMVEYRPEGATTWTTSNDYPASGPRHIVENLRPNGDYEFQVLAKDAEGRLSTPSTSSGMVRIRPAVPIRTTQQAAILQPGQPQATEIGWTWVSVEWAPSTSTASVASPPVTNFGAKVDDAPSTTRANSAVTAGGANDASSHVDVGYALEMREIGDAIWRSINETPASPSPLNGIQQQQLLEENRFTVEGLKPDSSYEFRVAAVSLRDGTRFIVSPPSAIVRTQHRPPASHANEPDAVASLKTTTTAADARRQPPQRPNRPEYLDFDGGNSVTICWIPADSVLPVLGYEVEYRDLMEGDAWQNFSVAPNVVRHCKTTIGNLFRGHQYQFRVFAHNANGRSPPSDASMLMTVGTSLKDAKYVEAERHAAVALLQDEMIRESPPLPDRDDSPPPIYRQAPGDNLQYRDPTLKEVLDYLKSNDEDLVQNASSYLQRLTFNNDAVKEDARNYGAIILLTDLLKSENPEILRNVCGCLKNLSFGRTNAENKKQICDCGGILALVNVIRRTKNLDVLEEVTGALWNISSIDHAKQAVLEKAASVVANFVVIPFSGIVTLSALERNDKELSPKCANIFRHGIGILRNISATNLNARKILRAQPNLIDAILHHFTLAVQKNQIKSRAVENCVCLLRNISYRVQEVVDPKYDPNSTNNRHNNSGLRASASSATLNARERSKSAPSSSSSPKRKTKKKVDYYKSKKTATPDVSAPLITPEISSSFPNGKSLGPSRLWHPETVKLYLHVLQECTSPEILEASASAIQNLAACNFEGSRSVRATVRTANGLPILSELLQLKEDRVVCSMVTALRNLAIDTLNSQEIAKYALPELIKKLPQKGQTKRSENISDATVYGVLGLLFEMIDGSGELTLQIHEAGGTQRLMTLARLYPEYGQRVCLNATLVLYNMWKHKELHEIFHKSGLNESDFHAATLQRGRKPLAHSGSGTPHSDREGASATLARPISSQGAERPSLLLNSEPENQHQQQLPYHHGTPTSANGFALVKNNDDDEHDQHPQTQHHYTSHQHQQQFNTSRTTPLLESQDLQTQNGYGSTNTVHDAYTTKREPLYAAVNKKNASATGVDSWV